MKEALQKVLAEIGARVRDPDYVALGRELAEREQAAAMARARADFPAWLRRCRVPRRFAALRYRAEWIPSELRRFCDGYPATLRHHAGGIIAGGLGSGKTAAACWCIRALYQHGELAGRPLRWVARTGLFLSALELSFWVAQRRWAMLQQLAEVDLLVLDGLEDQQGEFARLAELVERYIDARWLERRPTLVTTNIPPDAAYVASEASAYTATFHDLYPRAYSRLCDAEGFGVVECNREDLRSAGRR